MNKIMSRINSKAWEAYLNREVDVKLVNLDGFSKMVTARLRDVIYGYKIPTAEVVTFDWGTGKPQVQPVGYDEYCVEQIYDNPNGGVNVLMRQIKKGT